MQQLNLISIKKSEITNAVHFVQSNLRNSLDYLHGKCHLFAEALSRCKDVKVCFLIGYSDYELDLNDYGSLIESEIIHVFCLDESSGKLFDIRGQIKISDIEDYFELDIQDSTKFIILSDSEKFGNKIDLVEFKEDLICAGRLTYCDMELDTLQEFIHRYQQHYQ